MIHLTCGLATAVGILAGVRLKHARAGEMCKRHARQNGNIARFAALLFIDVPTVTMTGNLAIWVAATLLFLAALAGLARRWRSLTGSTLLASWYWTLAAMGALAACAIAISAGVLADGHQHLRYLSAIGTLCPLMAVLGAKRPQDRAWQFIVASLWIVAALPSLQQWFTRPQAVLELHVVWRWFLLLLIGVGLFNRLPTRYWFSGALAAVGQTGLLAEHVPLGWLWQSAAPPADAWRLGAIAWLAAIALWGWDLPRRRPTAEPLDRLWLDFRNLVGALWALRVMERINAAARQLGWRAHLGWGGWTIEAEPPAALTRSLRMLLRRFVSPRWIDDRLRPSGADEVDPTRSASG